MFGLMRLIVRSGGAIAVCLGIVGLAFYGIAQTSVMIVDEPARGMKVLGVFFGLSIVFCLMLKWVLRPGDIAGPPADRRSERGDVAPRLHRRGRRQKGVSLAGQRNTGRGQHARVGGGRSGQNPVARSLCVALLLAETPPGGCAKTCGRHFRSREIKRAADLRARSRAFFHLSAPSSLCFENQIIALRHIQLLVNPPVPPRFPRRRIGCRRQAPAASARFLTW